MIETEKHKNHSIMICDGNYSIYWIRGKDFFNFDVTQSLAEKSKKSDKDALEVMFYLENKRWPKEKELENINELINSGSLTEEQGKAFYAVAVDLAQTTKINNSSHYVLFSYQGGKVQLIFNGDSDLYYMTPNSKYLYFK